MDGLRSSNIIVHDIKEYIHDIYKNEEKFHFRSISKKCKGDMNVYNETHIYIYEYI